MKKYFSIVTSLALALGFTACEDVPAPYEIPSDQTETPVGDELLSETFASTLGSFTNATTQGAGEWKIDFKTAKASGYDKDTKKTTAGTYYLVSPEINLSGIDAAHVTFEYILAYNKGAENQQLLITDKYDAAKPAEGWTLISQEWKEPNKKEDGKIDWKTFHSAAINLPAQFIGKKVRIALRYNTDATSGSTWEVRNLKVKKGNVTQSTPDTPQPPVNGDLLNETFASTLGSFTNVTTQGAGEWKIDFKTAKASGYDKDTRKTIAGTYYLISPEVNLSGINAANLTFEYILAYNKSAENQQLLITDKYDAAKPADGWTLISQDWKEPNKKADGKIDWKTFHSATFGIPAEFIGKKVRIAFRYNTEAAGGSTWEIRNLKMK
ncbi:hypothetical protein EII14_00830 [Alloprevotella sp. OH1205_COT-284]|uniref:choice-of-anchor J domain-containing protein n=1 Tax=Alloprevotella sp. OH1205_COT-284 TaxID=2491043 RepID=UPI000F5FC888|nr:choice-of-anchor J domain-containing protein [Alloprevotella sp. OH1205_COT-284]RRD80880.1 hypothetical protein EII14_00830 [Alloprevotella sp. OH1205_COT-284]